jgi:hypothetical protein
VFFFSLFISFDISEKMKTLLSSLFCLITLIIVAIVSTKTYAANTSAPVAVVVECDPEQACYPWSARGPACSRGSRMNLRFQGSSAPENGVDRSGVPGNFTDVTYAFCPVVDELQAFNLTNFTRLAGVYHDSSTATWKLSPGVTKSYMSAIGFGNQTSRTLPPLTSQGKVLIMDNTVNNPCIGNGATDTPIGFVSFLVLNVSMNNGLFTYLAGHENPPGNGFVATCTEGDVCQIDPRQKCFGDFPGRKMCGKCYATAAELAKETMQIWVSYYGTDVNGRTMRSGASNPMNFLKYSLVDVFDALQSSYSNLKNVQISNPNLQTDLGP